MSIRLCSIRRIECINAVAFDHDISVTSGVWIEVFFAGYTGPRGKMRTKRFKSAKDVYAYLNKLNAGGWASDSDYVTSWNAVLRFEDLIPLNERSSFKWAE